MQCLPAMAGNPCTTLRIVRGPIMDLDSLWVAWLGLQPWTEVYLPDPRRTTIAGGPEGARDS
jgi:hypothetical protein